MTHNKLTHTEKSRKGGLALSKNREHMAALGRKGGASVSKDREHMARIGSLGGKARKCRDEDVPVNETKGWDE